MTKIPFHVVHAHVAYAARAAHAVRTQAVRAHTRVRAQLAQFNHLKHAHAAHAIHATHARAGLRARHELEPTRLRGGARGRKEDAYVSAHCDRCRVAVRADTRALGGEHGLDASERTRRPVVMLLAVLVGVRHLLVTSDNSSVGGAG